MSKRKINKLDETTELLKKVAQDPDSVTNAEKKQLKKLIGGDSSLMIEALQIIQKEQGSDYCPNTPPPSHNDDRTHEEIIADNYVTLAKFAIEKSGLKNVRKLKVQEGDCGFIIYALTPEPVELDLERYATIDYPANEELLLEAEALQADLFMEDNTEKYRLKIIQLIENSI